VSNDKQNQTPDTVPTLSDEREPVSRRKFLGTAALLGLSGAGLATGLAACKDGGKTASHGAAGSAEVLPGQLDTYYGLWSGGHSGEVRVLGMP